MNVKRSAVKGSVRLGEVAASIADLSRLWAIGLSCLSTAAIVFNHTNKHKCDWQSGTT